MAQHKVLVQLDHSWYERLELSARREEREPYQQATYLLKRVLEREIATVNEMKREEVALHVG